MDAGVIADLETGPIGSDAAGIVTGIRAKVDKMIWHNVDLFKRTGVESDLFADPPRFERHLSNAITLSICRACTIDIPRGPMRTRRSWWSS